MESVCDEIEASLLRSKLLIEQENRQRMYFYPTSRAGGGNLSKDNSSVVPNGTINSNRLKKYWNLLPKKKTKKPTDTLRSTSLESVDRWSSTKNRFGTVSGAINFDSEFRPAVYSPRKARGTLISPWENYSSVPDVIFEESDGFSAAEKFSKSVSRNANPRNKPCTCDSHSKIYGGSVRGNHTPTSCSCGSSNNNRFGTARPVMVSSNRKSILNKSSALIKLDNDNNVQDAIDSDAAYDSMYDSSPVSSSTYVKVGKFHKDADKNSKTESLYGTMRSRKSILECDVNPYELIRYQSKGDDDAVNLSDCDLDDNSVKPNPVETKNFKNSTKPPRLDKGFFRSKTEKAQRKSEKEQDKSKSTMYSKAEKGTMRIGGRAIAFHLKKERKMPKAYEATHDAIKTFQDLPRRSLSVPDIRLSAMKDEKPVVLHTFGTIAEPDPDYNALKSSSKVPSLKMHYESLAPPIESQKSVIPSVSSVLNRKSRTPSPTRKSSTPFQNSGVIYGMTPLRRPRAPPPPPPARKFTRQSSADSRPINTMSNGENVGSINSSPTRTMDMISEHGEDLKDRKSINRKISFNNDFRSILKRASFGENKSVSDNCSETSSSAYGSMNSQSEIRKAVKSILKKSSNLDVSNCPVIIERKKQVKFKSTSDNTLFVEDINDKLSIDGDNFDEEQDDVGLEEDSSRPLEPLEDGFISVEECMVSSPSSSTINGAKSTGETPRTCVKFELKSIEDDSKTNTVVKAKNNNVNRHKVIFESQQSTNIARPSFAPIPSSNNYGTIPSKKSPPGTSSTTLETLPENSNTEAIDFPEFDPDGKKATEKLFDQSTSNALPKNVDAPPTIEKADRCRGELMVRGRELSCPYSAKIELKTSDTIYSREQVEKTNEESIGVVAVVESSTTVSLPDELNKLEIISTEKKDCACDDGDEVFYDDSICITRINTACKEPIYDTVQSNTITSVHVSDKKSASKEPDIQSQLPENHATSPKKVSKSTFYAPCATQNDSPDEDEIDELYDDIAGVPEPIYEELSNNTIMNSSQKSIEKKSMFEGASKTEILSILKNAKERVMNDSDGSIDHITLPGSSVPKYEIVDGFDEVSSDHGIEIEELQSKRGNHPNRLSNLSNLSDSSTQSEMSQSDSNDPHFFDLLNHNSHRRRRGSAEIERNDSGVGSETSKPSKVRRHGSTDAFSGEINDDHFCEDCEQQLDSSDDLTESYFSFICEKCQKRRAERKEIVSEIVETEMKYGNDLKILKEEFYKPMEVAGLLMFDQLQNIFINLDELRKMNLKFVEKLTDALEIVNEQGDEDYQTLSIGKLFLESTPMLHSYETYCVQQSGASVLLNNLERDKELLKIFLCVSQMENALLRRMNLHAFLMVPVQRVMKYPLLLNRLYKVTPHHHKDRDALKEAQKKIELHLEHINFQTKGVSSTKIWRKISNISIANRRSTNVEEVGNIKLRTMALELLQWNREEVNFVKEGRLLHSQPSECIKRSKSVKYNTVNALLVTLGRPNNYKGKHCIDQCNGNASKATLLLVKEKGSRFVLLREQLEMKDCVISTELDSTDSFEVHLITSRDYFTCKAESKKETAEWAAELKKYAKDQGRWRQRRNALANIMISGMNRQ